MNKCKIKPRLSQITKYTEEEKYALYVERKINIPTPHKNKKKYTRKGKKQRWEIC